MLSDDQSRVNLPERYLVRYAAVCWQTGVLYSPSSPQRILGLADVARYLSGHYVTITVKRFPDGE